MIGIFELFVPGEELAAMIATRAPVESIHRCAIKTGFKPLIHDALERVETGVISLEEVARRLPPLYL